MSAIPRGTAESRSKLLQSSLKLKAPNEDADTVVLKPGFGSALMGQRPKKEEKSTEKLPIISESSDAAKWRFSLALNETDKNTLAESIGDLFVIFEYKATASKAKERA